jgi:hypothetical protein
LGGTRFISGTAYVGVSSGTRVDISSSIRKFFIKTPHSRGELGTNLVGYNTVRRVSQEVDKEADKDRSGLVLNKSTSRIKVEEGQ